MRPDSVLQDKLPEIVRTIYGVKLLVAASYKAKQSLAAKGLSPAIFLDPFYRDRKQGVQQIIYNYKQRQMKPLPDFIPIDIDDYTFVRKESKDPMEDIDEELLSKKIHEMLTQERIKYLREIDKSVFSDRLSVQKFMNNQSFHWFDKSNKMFWHGLTLGQENYRTNTSDQPAGICFLIQVQKQKTAKEVFDKVKTDVDFLLRRMFQLNNDQIANIKPMMIILFDQSQNCTVQQALQYTSYIKQNTNIHGSLIFRLPINGDDLCDSIEWSRFNRPILHFKYTVRSSDPIRIISQDNMLKTQQIIVHHRDLIRKSLQSRLDDLIRKYQQANKTTKILANFFKGSTPTEKTYNKEEMDSRELADKLFIIEDYKRAYDIYKNIAGKMDKRNANIQNNLSEMIQLCLTMSKFHNIKIKSNPYDQIQRYAEQRILKFYQNRNKLRLRRYLSFLIYTFYTFRTFNRQFIRSTFYSSIKSSFSQISTIVNVVPTLIYQQFANMNVYYANIEYRRYCYDLTRVSSRFTEIKLYAYALRCFLIVEALYRDTFANIEKYQFTQLSHLFLEARDYKQSLRNLKSAWQVYASRMQSQDVQKNQSQLQKVIQNYNKIFRQIERLAPLQLNNLIHPNLKIPLIHSLNLQTKDQQLEFDQKSGDRWQQIGEIILDNKELMSLGMNQREFRNMFRSFDFGVPEEKYLIHRFNSQVMTNGVLKKNSRNAYVGQPIRLSFYMRNPLRGDIQVDNISVKLKQTPQSPATSIQSNTNTKNLLIKSFKSAQVVFTIIPTQPGYLQLQSIQWKFMKLLSEYAIKDPREIKSDAKSCYFKLNVHPKVGCLEAQAYFEDYYYQGQRTGMKIVLRNMGAESITKIYIATIENQMFGFKVKQLVTQLAPNSQQELTLNIYIPLVHETIQSGEQKRICKLLILYRTGDRFRIARTINKFNILRIAKFENISCERLSTQLHLLSFTKKKGAGNEEGGLQWMIIPGGYDIVKKEAADLATKTNYFFFLRKGNFSLAKFQFQSWAKQIQSYPQQFLNLQIPQQPNQDNQTTQNKQTINIRFLWLKQKKTGYISKYNIPIVINEHGYLSTMFPISFKINYQKEVIHNFERSPFLEVPISIKLKNVLYNDELKVSVYFVEAADGDASWEGSIQNRVSLKMGSSHRIQINYVVVRPGIYILSNQIKYNITNSKGEHINIVHSQYQKIYLTVRPQGQTLSAQNIVNTNSSTINISRITNIVSPRSSKIDFQDAFKQFDMLAEQKTAQIKVERVATELLSQNTHWTGNQAESGQDVKQSIITTNNDDKFEESLI